MLSPEAVWYQIEILKKQLFLLGEQHEPLDEEQRVQLRKLLCLLQLLMRATWQNWSTDDNKFIWWKEPKLSPPQALAKGWSYLDLQACKYWANHEIKALAQKRAQAQESGWSLYSQEPWIQPERIPQCLFP